MTDTASPRALIQFSDVRIRLLQAILGIIATPILMQAVLIAGREPAR